MAKSLAQIKAALKLRAEGKNKQLTLRLGVKKYVLPFEVRLIQRDNHIFVHIPPSAEIFEIKDDGLTMITDATEADAVAKNLRRSRKRKATTSTKSAPVEVPAKLAAALAEIPAGYKLGLDRNGNPRFVKTRKRRK